MDEDQTDAPTASKPWLDAINEAEKAFQSYQDRCDRIEKIYGNLETLAEASGDREFQIFWANMEVLKPSMYQRPPQPVVMPRHTDTGEVPRKAAEMLERALEFDVEYDDVHEVMLQVRDDFALTGRAVPWVLDNGHVIHVDRKDFVHEPARKWSEVGFVARRAYIDRDAGVERFGDDFREAKTEVMGKDRGDEYQSTQKKAQVWEVWSKAENKVVWVTDGVDAVLDESEPLIDVKGFYPCPRPAYGTIQPGTLLPVPDFVYYRDQADEINELTARISALSESLRMKGFYAAGTSDVGEAIESAMAQTDNKAILIPISNFAALGGTALKDSIIWLPVAEIAKVIEQLVALRRQLIEDVYEITGLSDIMRGVTDAQETLGAQNLKAQFGSIRVREKQNELIRVALDIIRIKGEIFAETMPAQEVAQMAGMQIPSDAQIQQQVAQITQQAQAMAQQVAQSGQQVPPEQIQQAQQQVQAQVQQLQQTVTIEQIDQLLKNQRLRPFTLEIETDSTITPNEELEKQNRVEMLTAMGGFMQQALPILEAKPEAAGFMGELMKFGAGAFRSNRDLAGAIEQFVEQMKGGTANPDDGANKAEMAKVQVEQQAAAADMQFRQQELQMRAQEIQAKQAEAQEAARVRQYDAQVNAAIKQHELSLKAQEMGIKQDDQMLKRQQAEIQNLLDVEELKLERTQQRPVALGDNQ
jgi:hypothetical protein